MSSNISPRPRDFQPKSNEIANAVVLSSLAYLDDQQAMAEVETRCFDIGFQRILMAQNFIVGFDNNKTLYVSFRRCLSIQNMFSLEVADRKEFIESFGEEAKNVEGLFHYDLFQTITSELPNMSHFQHYKSNRIIFSGHGLAGALAHLFLICYMLKTREEDREHISIGFGSPYFCDSAAKRFCHETMELNRRMFTFVNGTDPLPSMLKDISMTLGRTGVQSALSCLERLNSANSDEEAEIASSSELNVVQSILKEMRSRSRSNMHHYVSVGVNCGGRGSTLRGSGIVESVLIHWDKCMSFIQQWVSPDAFSNQALQCSRVESYVKMFASDAERERFQSKPVMVVAPNPCIQACTLSVYDRETRYEGVITIRGSNLYDNCPVKPFVEPNISCPVKPIVEPNVGYEWKIEDESENSVLFKGILPKIEADAIFSWKKDETVEQTIHSVKLRTCFGSENTVLYVEDSWKDGYVASALARGMGRLLLMQQLEVPQISDLYREAFETLERGFSGPLANLSHSIPGTKRKHFDIMKSFFTRPLGIPFQNGQGFIECGMYLSTYLSSHPQLSSVIPDYACISKFCHGSYFSISEGRIGILNYRDIVRTIYCLLSGTEIQDDQSDIFCCEKKIYDLRGGQSVNCRQSLPEALQADIEERTSKMFEIITACNSLERLRFVTFIGPENAGKTTLINSILGEDVGGVGFTTHTTAATPYSFRDNIFVVDFPGTDGGGNRAHLSKIWEEYEKVADLCVVVLNFGGDTSRAAQVFPMIARSRMCDNVVLVLNRVDSVLNGSRNSPVWAEYSAEKVEQLKMSIAEISGLPAGRVFFSVLRANEELEETTRQLLKERHIMLKDEITIKVRELLLGLK